jgi:hypothetical protein
MNTRAIWTSVGIVACCCLPTMSSVAAAAAMPAPTLIRIEVGALDTPDLLTISIEKCVALVQARDFDAARPACNGAVSAARRPREQSSLAIFASRAISEDLAVAYNDRAVLYYVSGQLALAAADARRATNASRDSAVAQTAAVIEAAVGRVAKTQERHTAARRASVMP